MSPDHLSTDVVALIFTIVGATVAATAWVTRSMGKIEKAIALHVQEDGQKFENLTKRVVSLESFRKGKRR